MPLVRTGRSRPVRWLGKVCLRGQCPHLMRRSQPAKDLGEDGPGGSPAGAKALGQERVPSRPLWPEWGADVTRRAPLWGLWVWWGAWLLLKIQGESLED